MNILNEQYKTAIPKNKVFRGIKQEADKRDLFRHWVKNFEAKHIRAELGINFAVYRTYTDLYLEESQKPAPPVKRNTRKDVTVNDNSNKHNKRVIMEGDFIEIPAEVVEQKESQALALATQPPTEAPKKALISIDTTEHPDVLCDQINALLAFLRFQKEPLTLKLEVYK